MWSEDSLRQKLRFLTKKQVREKTTLSYAEIDRREHRLKFPKRHRLSEAPRGRVVWWEHEVDEWMRSQACLLPTDAQAPEESRPPARH
jgi:predicted DNA-binding transcriptional regulator AlpA